MTIVYLVRHGETDSNLYHRFQGTQDIPLNEQGRRQGDLLGQDMKNCPIDVIYSSTLSRARETAELIAKYHPGVKVIPYPGLEEIHAGKVEGELLSDIPIKFPQTFHCMLEDLVHLQYPGGESTRQVYDRMAKNVGEIVEQNRGKMIVIVSHGFSIQTYLHYASGRPFEEMESNIVANTSRCKFVFEDDSLHPSTQYINKHEHLSDDDLTQFCLTEEAGGILR